MLLVAYTVAFIVSRRYCIFSHWKFATSVSFAMQSLVIVTLRSRAKMGLMGISISGGVRRFIATIVPSSHIKLQRCFSALCFSTCAYSCIYWSNNNLQPYMYSSKTSPALHQLQSYSLSIKMLSNALQAPIRCCKLSPLKSPVPIRPACEHWYTSTRSAWLFVTPSVPFLDRLRLGKGPY